MEGIVNSGLFNWLILPLLIFFSRIIDVTIGTIRIILSQEERNIWLRFGLLRSTGMDYGNKSDYAESQ